MPAHIEPESNQTVAIHHENGRYGRHCFAMTPYDRIDVVLAPLRTLIGGGEVGIVTSGARASIEETRHIGTDRFAHGGVGQIQRVRKSAAKRREQEQTRRQQARNEQVDCGQLFALVTGFLNRRRVNVQA